MYRVVGRHSQKSGSGQEALLDLRDWSGKPPGYPGMVERLSRVSGNGRKTLPYVQEWSGGPPKCPGVIGRLSRMSGSCREAILEVRVTISDVPEW